MPIEKEPLKAAVYCRVSKEDQDANKQELLCREYCERYGIELYETYVDVISGISSQRPCLNKMLIDMRLYKFNTIVVSKLDRIGRSLSHLLSMFDEFNRKGVHFIAVTQNIDTSTAAGKLQMQMLGAFAEFERNMISERTKEALRKCKNVGKRGKDKKPRKKRGVLRNPHLYV